MPLPSVMKATVGLTAGPTNTMKVVADRAVPRAPAAESDEDPAAIIKVEYAALNPIDWKMMEWNIFAQEWPHCFGCDVSGEVVEVTDGAKFSVGDKVFAFTLLGEPWAGAFAEYVRVPTSMLGNVPSGVSMEAASTVGLGTLTAALGLYKNGKLPLEAPAGVPVLVYGAASATGVFAVSLLKASGYRVVAVASARHHEWLKDTVGAAQCVDYTSSDWKQTIIDDPANAGMRVAMDCIAGDGTQEACDDILQKLGAGDEGVISTVNPMAEQAGKTTLAIVNTGGIHNTEELTMASEYVAFVDKLLADGKIVTMPLEVIGGLDAVVSGLESMKEGKIRGKKLVVKI